jgi:hypothetical protein
MQLLIISEVKIEYFTFTPQELHLEIPSFFKFLFIKFKYIILNEKLNSK